MRMYGMFRCAIGGCTKCMGIQKRPTCMAKETYMHTTTGVPVCTAVFGACTKCMKDVCGTSAGMHGYVRWCVAYVLYSQRTHSIVREHILSLCGCAWLCTVVCSKCLVCAVCVHARKGRTYSTLPQCLCNPCRALLCGIRRSLLRCVWV